MGHKFSAVHGVKSEDFYQPNNAINEIWVGDLEVVSRLPFGDSDLGQAGWPPGDYPKIPWHQFIIPLKRRETVDTMPQPKYIFNQSQCDALQLELESMTTCAFHSRYQITSTSRYLAMYKDLSPGAAAVLGSLMMSGFFALCVLWPMLVWNHIDTSTLYMPKQVQDDQRDEFNRLAESWLRVWVRRIVTYFLIGVVLFILGMPAAMQGAIGYDGPKLVYWTALGLIIGAPILATGYIIASVVRVKRTLNRLRQSSSGTSQA